MNDQERIEDLRVQLSIQTKELTYQRRLVIDLNSRLSVLSRRFDVLAGAVSSCERWMEPGNARDRLGSVMDDLNLEHLT